MTTGGQLRRRMALSALIGMFRPGGPGLGRRLAAVPRMVRATLRHEYDGGGRLGMIALSALYILSPIDFVPEMAVALVGLVDDAAVAAYFAGALLDETQRFLEWEERGRRPRGPVIPGTVLPPQD